MNVYNFIQSNAIRTHLEKINYSFSAPETAFLIWQYPEATLKERFEAWREVIDTMPDCSMPARMNMKEIPSLHAFLREYMELQDRLVTEFYNEKEAVYSYECCIRECPNDTWRRKEYLKEEEFKRIFSDFDTCRKCLLKDINRYPRCDYSIHVKRQSLTNPEYILLAEMNEQLEIISIEDEGVEFSEEEVDTLLAFLGMWFNFPTPFKTGDVLCEGALSSNTTWAAKAEDTPFVLDSIATWNEKEWKENHVLNEPVNKQKHNYDWHVEHLLKDGDTTDMSYSAYYMEEKEDSEWLFRDNGNYYLSLEYYTGELTGANRFLLALSSFLKGKLRGDELVQALLYIIAEGKTRRLSKGISVMRNQLLLYREETAELTGLKEWGVGYEKETEA